MRALLFALTIPACGLGLDKDDPYADADADGYPAFSDCDEDDADVHPFADEVCDDIDNDCDGEVDEDADDGTLYYPDLDQDGYGDSRFPVILCAVTAGYVADGTDCNDVEAAVNPEGYEICDGLDNDCDGYTDDEDAFLDKSTLEHFYADADGDGYGNPDRVLEACQAPSGYISVGADDEFDCDDTTALAQPGGEELCGDGIDNDCDGTPNDCGLQGDYELSSIADATLWGEAESDYAGRAVANAGDTNGDGLGDFVVGAYYASNSSGTRSGAAYVVTGAVTGTLDLTSAGGLIDGAQSSDYIGWSVAGGGDVDDDGFDDVLLGSPYEDGSGTNAGAAYLIGGPVTGEMKVYDGLAQIKGNSTSDYLGWAVAILGDMDGDGDAEVAVSAYGDDDNGTDSGSIFIFEGPVEGIVQGTGADAQLLGYTTSDYAGYSLSGAGDVDGDGRADLVVGAHGNDTGSSGAGAVYIVRGPVEGTVGLSAADGTIYGTSSSYPIGQTVAGGGDVDGDGLDDVLVASLSYSSSSGAVWLMLGPATGSLSLSDAQAMMVGESSSDQAGYSISLSGDVDGDGKANILIGAMYGDGLTADTGAAYLLGGSLSGTISLSDADAMFYGTDSSDYVGSGVAIVQDTDGGGFDDILVGSYGDDTWGSNAGAVYLILGSGI